MLRATLPNTGSLRWSLQLCASAQLAVCKITNAALSLFCLQDKRADACTAPLSAAQPAPEESGRQSDAAPHAVFGCRQWHQHALGTLTEAGDASTGWMVQEFGSSRVHGPHSQADLLAWWESKSKLRPSRCTSVRFPGQLRSQKACTCSTLAPPPPTCNGDMLMQGSWVSCSCCLATRGALY